jgi:hypothetical protein
MQLKKVSKTGKQLSYDAYPNVTAQGSHANRFFNEYDLSEEDKLSEDYLKSTANTIITQLVTNEKKELTLAYNMYNLKRDKREFAWLTENYGVGNPKDVPFYPLIKTQIQYLIGKFLENDIPYQPTCNNKEALDYIEQTKKNEVIKKVLESINNYNASLLSGGKESQELLEKQIKQLQSYYKTHYKTDLEMCAYDVIEYYKQAKDLKDIIRWLVEDYFVGGCSYWRTYITEVGVDPIVKRIDPRFFYYNKASGQKWVRNADRCVYVERMTKQQVLQEYGHLLQDGDIEELYSWTNYSQLGNYYNPTYNQNLRGYPLNTQNGNMVPNNVLRQEINVYHVEWISSNPVVISDGEMIQDLQRVETGTDREEYEEIKRYRNDRYECVRIGNNIFPIMGKSKYVSRTNQEPYKCTLSYDGFCNEELDGKPLSLILSTKDMQDDYDLLNYVKNSIYPKIEPGGMYLNIAQIPNEIDGDFYKRIEKWIGMKKDGGIAWINTAQEGAELSGGQTFGGYESNLKGDLLQALDYAINELEERSRKITGVPRQAEGEVEQQDLVGNTLQAIKQGAIVNKPLYFQIGLMCKHLFTQLVNTSRIAYSKGKHASYILGEYGQKIFSIDGDKFSIADYNIFISDATEEHKQLEIIKQMTSQALQAQLIDIYTALDISLTTSLSEAKKKLEEKLNSKENEQVSQLSQQNQQLQEQLKQMETELQKVQKIASTFDQDKLKQDKEYKEKDYQLKLQELEQKKKFEDKKNELIEQRTKLEQLQVLDTVNTKDDKVANKLT